MDDRTLLELAAKAAGYRPYRLPFDADAEVVEVNGLRHLWNSLLDDGDALRLAVAIKAKITIGNSIVMVEVSGHPDIGQPFTENAAAATRRAITRAAAEIGKSRVSAPGAVEGGM